MGFSFVCDTLSNVCDNLLHRRLLIVLKIYAKLTCYIMQLIPFFVAVSSGIFMFLICSRTAFGSVKPQQAGTGGDKDVRRGGS